MVKHTLVHTSYVILHRVKLDANLDLNETPGELIMIRMIRLGMFLLMGLMALLFIILMTPDLFSQSSDQNSPPEPTMPQVYTRNNPYRRIDTWAQYQLQSDAEHVRLVAEVKRLGEKLEEHLVIDRKEMEKSQQDRQDILLLQDRFNSMIYIVGTICFAAIGQLIAYIFQIRLRRELYEKKNATLRSGR